MAADLTLRHTTVPTPFGPFTVVMSPDGVVATTGGDPRELGDVAQKAGRPGAARAAGSALAKSPIELFVPCHRVVPSGPGLGRYGGAEDRRATLLRFEGAI
jgi:methylated-DNA-[protein]-cysteine S-methyltransferase